MAPTSAGAVVLMFFVLLPLVGSQRKAMWLALAYGFATPVFFRTGFLNHNLMLGHIAFAGFAALWNPWNGTRLSSRGRDFVCGLGGGAAILFDYTGVVLISLLGLYVIVKRWREAGPGEAVRGALWYGLGTLGPVLLLWFYQWAAFGNPFLPGQHWMPPVQWSDRGYQGYQFPPQPELLWMLLADIRFGLFVSAPILLLALAAPWLSRGGRGPVPPLELWTMLLVALGTWLFFGGSNYTRLQFNTGIRYLACLFPFLYVPAAVVLARLRPASVLAWVMLGLAVAWPLAMYRKVQFPIGVLDPIARTFISGITLPVLRTLSDLGGAYGGYAARGTSPLAAYALAAVVIWALWSPRFRRSTN